MVISDIVDPISLGPSKDKFRFVSVAPSKEISSDESLVLSIPNLEYKSFKSLDKVGLGSPADA